MSDSDLEHAMMFHLRREGVKGWVREYVFHPVRKWRLDFYFPDAGVGVEVDGGIYGSGDKAGRHNRGAGMEADNEKLNAAVSMGIVVLRFGPKAVNSGAAVEVIKEALNYWMKGGPNAA